jgi:hypothetical protein
MQSTVRLDLGYGLPGEVAYDGPMRAQMGQIDPAATAANCLFGSTFFTLNDTTGLMEPGGDLTVSTNSYGGLLCNPKQYASLGTPGNPLAATMQATPGNDYSFGEMGFFFVQSANGGTAGNVLAYVVATGQISAYATVGAIPEGSQQVPNAVVSRMLAATSPGIIVAKFTN